MNKSASIASTGKTAVWQFFAFIILLFIYLYALRKSSKENVISTQSLMHTFKIRIMSQVLKADLKTIDDIGRPWILQILVRDTQTVSQSILSIVQIAQSASTLIFLLIYIGFVSVPAFLIVLVASFIIFFLVSNRISKTTKAFSEAWHYEGESLKVLSDFMDGFKEIKMNSKRAAELSSEIVFGSRKSKSMKIEAMFALVNATIAPQLFFYILVGIAVFVLPVLFKDYSNSVQSITTSIMFLVGALGGIVGNIPPLAQASASAEELLLLEEKLNKIEASEDNSKGDENFSAMKSLELKNLVYQYDENKSDKSFSIGPVSYIFEPGKIYFVRGNNGSGKSTLIRLLIGLYKPTSGGIYFNGDLVSQPASPAYRNLFSVVFSDFHLFKRLYGIYTADDKVISAAIDLLGMSEKTKISDNSFSDINLSTGQRKRIALITAILEDRPIIVLDEWASDQDPEFRKYFYEFILPELKNQGKTIIAITHDDQYYSKSDHLIKIQNGMLAQST
ncbi:cyclic peptide export ABC transporter [Polynucleobacter sp.]|uniref:cyclic peptide export ABC transporter n=1 Tax=Polynucleobacter sp. TaxID=2029855 RepID=UPI0033417B38